MSVVQQIKERFDYDTTLIKEYNSWGVLLRNQQVTIGSLILLCREDVTEFHLISREAMTEYHSVIYDVETKLKSIFGYNKINYLMLMMYDPVVHFHVIPRYDRDVNFENKIFLDTGWPDLPDLYYDNKPGKPRFQNLRSLLIHNFD